MSSIDFIQEHYSIPTNNLRFHLSSSFHLSFSIEGTDIHITSSKNILNEISFTLIIHKSNHILPISTVSSMSHSSNFYANYSYTTQLNYDFVFLYPRISTPKGISNLIQLDKYNHRIKAPRSRHIFHHFPITLHLKPT